MLRALAILKGRSTINQIYEISYSYYIHFYSYKGRIRNLWPWIVLTLVTGIGFIIFVAAGFLDLANTSPKGYQLYMEMKWMIIFEILFLISITKLQNRRTNLLTRNYESHSKAQRLALAKRDWIKSVTGKSEFEFLDLGREIRDLQDLKARYSREVGSWFKVFINCIYASEAKTRITSYLIFFMSIIALLSIRNSEGIQAVLSALDDSEYKKLLVLIAVISGFIFISWIGIIYFVQYLVSAVDTAFSIVTSSKRSSYRFVDTFSSDLIALHRQPRIKCELNANKSLKQAKL